jgi:hypothetical protein
LDILSVTPSPRPTPPPITPAPTPPVVVPLRRRFEQHPKLTTNGFACPSSTSNNPDDVELLDFVVPVVFQQQRNDACTPEIRVLINDQVVAHIGDDTSSFDSNLSTDNQHLRFQFSANVPKNTELIVVFQYRDACRDESQQFKRFDRECVTASSASSVTCMALDQAAIVSRKVW